MRLTFACKAPSFAAGYQLLGLFAFLHSTFQRLARRTLWWASTLCTGLLAVDTPQVVSVVDTLLP